MNIEEILTAEAVKVILSGISWKQSEGDMEDDSWDAIRPFMDYLKVAYPELSGRDASYLF